MCKSGANIKNANVQNNLEKMDPKASVQEEFNFYELHAPTTHTIASTVLGFLAVLVIVYFIYRYYAGSSDNKNGGLFGCLKRRNRRGRQRIRRSRSFDDSIVMAVRDYQQNRALPDVQAFRQNFRGPELADVLSRGDMERQMPVLRESTDSGLGERQKY